MNKLISVIIPVYNVEKYLKKCVDSVIAQTYKNLEIILVDDGSPDNCGKICDEYAQKDKRIIVIHKKNGGLSDARNAGIDICKGKYISFVDSDDFVSPIFIETLYRGITKFNSDISSINSGLIFYDGEEKTIRFTDNVSDENMKESTSIDAIRQLLYQCIPNGVQWRLYKREIWYDLRFPVGWLFEDAATTHRAFMKASKISFIDTSLYAYRLRRDSIVGSKFSIKKMISIEIGRRLINDINNYDKSLLKAAYSRAFSLNYQVFFEVPFEDKASMRKLWNEIIRYRQTVLFDPCRYVRSKNRVGAAISYFGMNAAWNIGRRFSNKSMRERKERKK